MGGFNINTTVKTDAEKKVDAEENWSYELGLRRKYESLQFSSTIFYMDWSDMQVFVRNGISNPLVNAGKASSQGIEFELDWQLHKDILLSGSYGYTNAEFKEYHNGTLDYKNNKLASSPGQNANLALTYNRDSGFMSRIDIRHTGAYYLNDENTIKQDSFQLVNFKIGWEGIHNNLYFWAKNLSDEKYYSFVWPDIISGQTNLGIPGDQRTFGVEYEVVF